MLTTTTALAEFVRGSYEDSIARIRAAVSEARGIRVLTESGQDVAILATHPDRVLVCTSTGKYLQASVQLSPAGHVVLGEFVATQGPQAFATREALREHITRTTARAALSG